MQKLKLSKIVTSCGLVCKKQAYPAIIVSQDAPNSGVSAYSGPPTEVQYNVQSTEYKYTIYAAAYGYICNLPASPLHSSIMQSGITGNKQTLIDLLQGLV